ncbi:peptidase [Pseudoalteromonas sp. MEBiC 03607]|uniref:S41 family peptidase n=1 Tax=Pseudoalteromonas sp. MEBiC 03607 TaxID=2563601 RepID=UPI001093EB0F|nr:S41 family peptidase [Pseudoalteromonas sp. MEBiC 03607]TGV18811.1 peptidase [Pseudoalteromonas sp. MEBiC 03607]
MFNCNKLAPAVFLAVSGFSLTGCGGGSGSSDSTTNPPPPTTSEPSWTAGVFAPSSEFKNQCAVPRTGNDPYNNNRPYPDTAGSEFTEKMWLRSWSDETYLWYDEIEDNDPDNFNSVAAYFAQLKTYQTTDSGAYKDNFHFSRPTEEYYKEAQSGVVSGYGINWAFLSNVPPRELRIAYLEDDSPAKNVGLQRGDTILMVDGVSINTNTQEGVDILNEALFGPTAGDSHNFVVRSNDGSEKSFTLVAGNIAQTPVQNVNTITTANGTKVGYMQFNSFISIAQPELISAVNKFKSDNIDELVIDFRYNGGGLLALSSQLAYMVAGPANTDDYYYYQTIKNDKQPQEAPYPFIDREIDYSTFQTTNSRLPDLNLSKVYVLSTAGTCSASEAFINGLKGIDAEVVLIGDTTCGKPYGFTPTHNCATTYYTIQFSGANDKGFGEYADGFKPTPSPQFDADVKGCVVADDFDNKLGDTQERLFSTAIHHIENGSCPIVVQTNNIKQPSFASQAEQASGIPLSYKQPLYKENMDLTRPSPAKDDNNEQ